MKRPNSNRSAEPREPVPQELVTACRSGDERAWARLVELTYREVYTLCLRILRDPDDAAEATQDAYLKAWRGLKGFRGESQFNTWLYRVAMNAAISRQRSRKRRQSHETGAGDAALQRIPSTRASTEADATARIDVQRLQVALDQLPDHYRLAVLLRDVYGATIEEIAEQLKISNTAAKVRVHRGRKKLRDELWSEDEEP